MAIGARKSENFSRLNLREQPTPQTFRATKQHSGRGIVLTCPWHRSHYHAFGFVEAEGSKKLVGVNSQNTYKPNESLPWS